MKNKNSDPSTMEKSGKSSKAIKIKLFEKKLRDIYSDDTVFIRPDSNMTKKKRSGEFVDSPVYYFDEIENKIAKMDRAFEYADKKSIG